MVEQFTTQAITYGARIEKVCKQLATAAWVPQAPGSRRKVRVVLYTGAPDSGKSRGVQEFLTQHLPGKRLFTASWSKPGEALVSYDGEDVVLFDDFAGQLDIHLMKTLLDVHPCSVRVMYAGNMPWIPTWIFITTNRSIADWWINSYSVDVAAIERRITQSFDFVRTAEGNFQRTLVANNVPWWRKEQRPYAWKQVEEQTLLDDKDLGQLPSLAWQSQARIAPLRTYATAAAVAGPLVTGQPDDSVVIASLALPPVDVIDDEVVDVDVISPTQPFVPSQ